MTGLLPGLSLGNGPPRKSFCLRQVSGLVMVTPGTYWKNLTIGGHPCSHGPERALSKGPCRPCCILLGVHCCVSYQAIVCFRPNGWCQDAPGRSSCMDMEVPSVTSLTHCRSWLSKGGPFAHAMVGYLDQLPAWCQDDLRPVMGTSCDFRIHVANTLTRREQLLLLSMWRRIRFLFFLLHSRASDQALSVIEV